jgi:antitoxin HicB
MPHVYAALLEPEPEGGFTVTFPEMRFGATYGATWDEALRQAEDMLEEAVLGLIAHGEGVPEPAPPTNAAPEDATCRAPIALAALTAKLELYRAMRQAGFDEKRLAQRLGWPPKKITDLFDGYHAVRLEQLEAALAPLGRRLVVTSEPAQQPAVTA